VEAGVVALEVPLVHVAEGGPGFDSALILLHNLSNRQQRKLLGYSVVNRRPAKAVDYLKALIAGARLVSPSQPPGDTASEAKRKVERKNAICFYCERPNYVGTIATGARAWFLIQKADEDGVRRWTCPRGEHKGVIRP
jgi:hypothetical protein